MGAPSWPTGPRRFLSFLVLPAIVGRAAAKDTPQQEYVWAMGRICDARSNTWYLDKVRAHPYAEWVKTRPTQ